MITINPSSVSRACRELHVKKINPRHHLPFESYAVITPNNLYLPDWGEPSLYRSIPLSGLGSGEYAINAVTLRDLARVCDEPLSIYPEGKRVIVTSGNCRYELASLPMSEFPPRKQYN